MGIEYLNLAENGMQDDYGCCCLPDKPVTGYNIKRRSVERIWMN